LTLTFGVGLAVTERTLRPPARLGGELQSCVIWYESFRQSSDYRWSASGINFDGGVKGIEIDVQDQAGYVVGRADRPGRQPMVAPALVA